MAEAQVSLNEIYQKQLEHGEKLAGIESGVTLLTYKSDTMKETVAKNTTDIEDLKASKFKVLGFAGGVAFVVSLVVPFINKMLGA